ncbi:MAG: peptidoglycan D,D-transpeptidase FtsI family protein [Desulfotomaculales bacterium]
MAHLRQVRLLVLGLGFFAAFIAITVRLLTIQIGQHARYLSCALQQHAITVPLEEAPRGLIVDRHLTPLAGKFTQYRVVVIPGLLENRYAAARDIARILGVPASDITRYLNAGGLLPFPVTKEQARKINRASLAGITAAPVALRYDDRPLAVHVVGHLGRIDSSAELARLRASTNKPYHAGDLVGKAGIEKYYEARLKGTAPRQMALAYTDATGKLLAGQKVTLAEAPDKDRQNIVLTLDACIQRVAEEVMDRHKIKGAIVVQEVSSGDILAMASRPAYHPGEIEEYLETSDGAFTNRALTLYFPGSLFKIVVAAAALEEGVVDENDYYFCSGHQDRLVHCWLPEGHGGITFARAFAESCNPVFARIAVRLGADRLVAYARRLGLENQAITGFPHPPDPRQTLNAIKEPYNLVNAAIGHWPVFSTPVQMCTLVATVARGGIYRQPRLVKSITQGGTIVENIPPAPSRRVLSLRTARKLQNLMGLVTTEGQGREAYVPGWGASGKTGTVETAQGERLAWFAGYAPAEHPRLAIAVLVEGGSSGSRSAAPIFSELTERILRSQ